MRRCLTLAATSVLGVLAAAYGARAEHHLVERALQEARCIPASVRETSRSGGSVTYAAECRDASRRALTLVCTLSRCFIDDHGAHDREIEEDDP